MKYCVGLLYLVSTLSLHGMIGTKSSSRAIKSLTVLALEVFVKNPQRCFFSKKCNRNQILDIIKHEYRVYKNRMEYVSRLSAFGFNNEMQEVAQLIALEINKSPLKRKIIVETAKYPAEMQALIFKYRK